MVHETLTFTCPACAVKLTVPTSLAGIVGPCPSCGTQIQAPLARQPEPPRQAAMTAPLPVPPAPSEPTLYSEHPTQAPAPLKPEPRNLPTRADAAEPIRKPMPARSAPLADMGAPATPSARQRSKRWPRVLIPLLAVGSAAALVAGLHHFLTQKPGAKGGTDELPPILAAREIFPEASQAAPHTGEPEPTVNNEPEILIVPNEPEPDNTLASPEPGAESPGIAALRVLETFLNADSLDERLPLIETLLNADELADTCLARSLPPRLHYDIDVIRNEPAENLVLIYCNVDFDRGNGKPNPQTLLLVMRGGQSPKVVVEPFLDLFCGRLADYASKPNTKPAMFHAIVSAGYCYDDKVPNHDEKRTLKLLARDNTKEIANAYFGRQSRIARMLQDDQSGIRYGQAVPCTVLIDWNRSEDPENPYLEAIEIKALGWTP